MDAYVQFVRNFMCCILDLQIPLPRSPQWYLSLMKSGIIPSPVDETPYLKLCVALTQMYACVTVTVSAYKLLTRSLSDLAKYKKYSRNNPKSSPSNNNADIVVDTFIYEKIKASQRGVFIGFSLFGIGPPFLWLTANSLQITRAGWIGGLPSLIHALTSMELFLIPLLYYMLKDGIDMILRARKMRNLSEQISKSSRKSIENLFGEGNIDVGVFGWLESNRTAMNMKASETDVDAVNEAYASPSGRFECFDPFKNEMSSTDVKEVFKIIAKAKASVAISLDMWKCKDNERIKLKEAQGTNNPKIEAAISPLLASADRLQFEGCRELLYFLLNFIAFYGYMLCILVYYFDDESLQPTGIRKLQFGMSNSDADWYGNFAGDFAWTIEPLVVLFSPVLLEKLGPTQMAKSKKD